MKPLLFTLFLTLLITPPVIPAQQEGWPAAALGPDGKEVLDSRYHGTLDYDEMEFTLTTTNKTAPEGTA